MKARSQKPRTPEQIEKNKAYLRKYYAKNREKMLDYGRSRYAADPKAFRAKALRSRFGITLDQYESMFLAQNGRCLICKGEPNGRGVLHVDHDHATGKIRALLCSKCNTMIGLSNDRPEVLRSAANYLQHFAGDLFAEVG